MAYTSGTATDYLNLLSVLKTFLTSTLDSEERWTALRDEGGAELILQGPGSGDDEIFIGFKSVDNVVGDYFNWQVGGFTGYLSGEAFSNQPGFSGEVPSPQHLPLWDSTIPYWIVANGRRVIVVAKVSTRYMWCYLGFPSTYASPGQYPYPLIVAAPLSWGNTTVPATTSANWRWSYTGVELSNPAHAFWNSNGSPVGGYTKRGQMRIRTAAGAWRDLWSGWNSNYSPGNITSITDQHRLSGGSLSTWRNIPDVTAALGGIWPGLHQISGMDPAVDGSYVMLPIILMAGIVSGDTPDLFGELEGIYHVTGGPAAEDVVEIDGVDYLMVPNVFRSNRADFVAVRLS